MENKKIKSNGINIKNFWVYALILFSVALILIMISNVFQDSYYKQIKAALTVKEQKEIENMSTVDSIQKVNENYKKKIDDYEKETASLTEQNELQNGNLLLAEQNVKSLTIINDAQTLYIQKKLTAARKKLSEINADTLPNDIALIYDNIYKLLH